MSAPNLEHFDFDTTLLKAAARNWRSREFQRENNKIKVATGRLKEVETAERIETNLRFRTESFQAARQAADAARGMPALDLFQERVIGDRDFLGIEFLEMAAAVARFVGRVHIRAQPGKTRGFGTGFVVSPRLFLTNNHVLPSPEMARHSQVEFDYQKNRFGQPLPLVVCALEPETFFLTDRRLDFTLVALSDKSLGGLPLNNYAWVRLHPESGKALINDALNIIQHPRGEMKQLVLRSNRLVDSFDDFVHYETDTEPGSSGSPVLSDSWHVVALHHSGVPKTNDAGDLLDVDGHVWREGRDDPARIAWVGNEGIRISSLISAIARSNLDTAAQEELRRQLLEIDPPHPLEVARSIQPVPQPVPPVNGAPVPGGTVTLMIPLHVTVSLGTPVVVSPAAQTAAPVGVAAPVGLTAAPPDEILKEKIDPDPSDPDYENRPGYDSNFLGFAVPFPKLTNVSRPKAYVVDGADGDDATLIRYHHYSVIFNKARKLAFVAGVNYDPMAKVQHPRDKEGDKWFYDPRVKPEDELQAGEKLYVGNPLDRGHLVRRADAAWGATKKEAKLANDDTFHFTNCSPQHAITNQGKVKEAPPGLKLWGKLEDHIASEGKKNKRRLCIFNGPVFRKSDKMYREILQLPKAFWKVVVFVNDAGKLGAAAFVLTQADLIADLKEEFEVGEYKAVQFRMKDLETKTQLDFGPFRKWDVLEKDGAEESFTGDAAAIVLESLANVVL